jgi:hypothetical protein
MFMRKGWLKDALAMAKRLAQIGGWAEESKAIQKAVEKVISF